MPFRRVHDVRDQGKPTGFVSQPDTPSAFAAGGQSKKNKVDTPNMDKRPVSCSATAVLQGRAPGFVSDQQPCRGTRGAGGRLDRRWGLSAPGYLHTLCQGHTKLFCPEWGKRLAAGMNNAAHSERGRYFHTVGPCLLCLVASKKTKKK